MAIQAISRLAGAESARLLSAACAVLLGFGLVLAVGFARVDAVHNATHDTRHSAGFPLPLSLRFGRIAACAALAGILASLPLTLAQAWWVTPLILQAETYEDAQAGSDSLHHDSAAVPSETLVAGEAAWQPEDGWQRTLSTAAANGALGIGHALILVGLFSLRRPLGVKQGLAWGLAGYTAFFVAPGLGLPPELPGTAAADLAARQYWWLGTVLATAGGLALLFLQGRWQLRVAAVFLLAAPHVIGAPQPPALLSLAPEALQAQFRAATLVSNALFWLALGAASAGLFRRWCGTAGS